MVISGLLSVTDLINDESDLETRAKNFLKLKITDKNGFLHSPELIEEINFLINKEYVEKEGNLAYKITDKGREYILGD